MKVILRFIGLILAVVPLWCNGFIYQISVLKKWDPQYNKFHYFIGCGDFHDKAHEKTTEQQKQIDALLNQCNAQNTKVILEDLSCKGGKRYGACGTYKINSRGGILGGLTQKCKDLGLPVENIEYRFCRVVALGPVLKNITFPPDKLSSVKGTKVAALLSEINEIVKEIRAYGDGDVLHKIYKQGINESLSHLHRLQLDKNKQMPVSHYLNMYTTSRNKMRIVKRLLTFDSGLLDLKLVHSVVNARDKERVIAFAGGSHIAQVSKLLQQVGYKKVYSTHLSYGKEYDLKRCLGSHITAGKFCVKPKPVNLDVLKKFL